MQHHSDMQLRHIHEHSAGSTEPQRGLDSGAMQFNAVQCSVQCNARCSAVYSALHSALQFQCNA